MLKITSSVSLYLYLILIIIILFPFIKYHYIEQFKGCNCNIPNSKSYLRRFFSRS